jgi:hypothetical protein
MSDSPESLHRPAYSHNELFTASPVWPGASLRADGELDVDSGLEAHWSAGSAGFFDSAIVERNQTEVNHSLYSEDDDDDETDDE